MSTGFQSVGAPPEQHANRVIAEMLRELAKKRAQIAPAIAEAFRRSKDGSPRAQQRMAERIRQAGAMHVFVKPGTRGRYTMVIHKLLGWDPARNAKIGIDDAIPEKPWVVCWVTGITDRGRLIRSTAMLLGTHHALSRSAQRSGVRTPADVIAVIRRICDVVLRDFAAISSDGIEAFFTTPPQGRRVRTDDNLAIVLQRHRTRRALVVATVVRSLDELDGPAPAADLWEC